MKVVIYDDEGNLVSSDSQVTLEGALYAVRLGYDVMTNSSDCECTPSMGAGYSEFEGDLVCDYCKSLSDSWDAAGRPGEFDHEDEDSWVDIEKFNVEDKDLSEGMSFQDAEDRVAMEE